MTTNASPSSIITLFGIRLTYKYLNINNVFNKYHYYVHLKLSTYRPRQDHGVPDSRHIKVVRLLALHTGRLYPPGNIPGTQIC